MSVGGAKSKTSPETVTPYAVLLKKNGARSQCHVTSGLAACISSGQLLYCAPVCVQFGTVWVPVQTCRVRYSTVLYSDVLHAAGFNVALPFAGLRQ